MASAIINGVSATLAPMPVGSVVSWWRADAVTPVPDRFVICDGSAISDADSPYNGQNAPDLRNKFLRGVSTDVGYGGPAAPAAAGADTHSHTVAAHTHGISPSGDHSHGNTGTNSTSVFTGAASKVSSGGHEHYHATAVGGNHSHTGGTASASPGTNSPSNVPAYVGLLFIMKYK